jgi:hypothetical protein
MASTPEGRRLTEAHRQAQQQVRADFLLEFLALWALLDTARLDDTGPGWVRAVMRAVAAHRLVSAEVATQYFYDFAAAEAPSSTARPRPAIELPPGVEPSPTPPAAPPQRRQRSRRDPVFPARRESQTRRPRGEDVMPRGDGSGLRWDVDEVERPRTRIEIPDIDWTPRDRAVEVSLNVTGPIGQKSKIKRKKPLRLVQDESFVQAAGAASRHVLDGGNRSALKLIEDDDRLIGYIRVTDGDPCYFCAMLASRGPVYRTPRRAGPNVRGERNARAGLAFEGEGAWKVHDNCACTVEPVFSSNTQWPGRGREFEQLWRDNIAKRYSGDEAVRQWRRVYEEYRREQRRAIA